MSEPVVISSLAVLSAGVTCLCLAKFYGVVKSLAEEVESLVTNVWTIERRSHRVEQDHELAEAFAEIQVRALDLEVAVERLRGAAQREVYAPDEVLLKAAAYTQKSLKGG